MSSKALTKILLLCSVAVSLIPWECAATTTVYKCDSNNTQAMDGVTLENCSVPRCPLKRNTTMHVEIKFKSEFNIKDIITEVYGHVFNIPVPLLGVDNKSVCNNIFTADGAKTTCPLLKGNDYVYKDIVRILEVYPKLKINVHYSLKDPTTKKIVACFEVPAKITD
ncbi:NPC intracellular cholesterol transporter 2 homolog a-like [Adelges cooleyi]|uniref:NPC intracellular cholesterol transporter 2 homolog a-like n=1 Tax=Adelges cooleyi TaxID=133065 RepID=UPI00217F8E00|nr:NPC intracellular cholesterol transporter 2 homolog a-like [Adelges cooleyi]